jgi:hypothetical protein
MPPRSPQTDQAPLDHGGQTPGQGNPQGTPTGVTVEAAPAAPYGARSTVPQSEDFVLNLGTDIRELRGSLNGVHPPEEAPKTPRKRLQEHSPEGLGRAPAKSPFSQGHRGIESALLEHLISGKTAIYTEITAIKAHITSIIEALEQRLDARLGAIENRFKALETRLNTPNAPNHPLEPLSSRGDHQGQRQPLPSQETTFMEAMHGPPTNQNRGAKPTKPQEASSPISKSTPGTKPVTQPAGKPRATPQWADIAANGAEKWQTVTRKHPLPPHKPPKVQADPGSLKPIRGGTKGDRRLIFRRENGHIAPRKPKADVILQLNRYLAQAGFPSFIRVVDANYTGSGAISALLDQGGTTNTLIPAYKDPLVTACHRVDPAVISVEPDRQWHKVKVHAVPVARYSASGLGLAREEIELGGTCTLVRDPTWIKPLAAIQAAGQRFSTIVITVGGPDEARSVLTRGIRFGGNRHPTSPYHEVGKDSVCTRCCGIGHRSYRACGTRPPLCTVCAGPHEAREHACNVVDCRAPTGHPCSHAPTKCGNCGGNHQAESAACPKLREARRRLHKRFPRIEVVVPPPPLEREAQDGVTEAALPPIGTQESPQAPELRAEDAMDEEGDQGTSPLPYTSPCPSPMLGAADPINVDISA